MGTNSPMIKINNVIEFIELNIKEEITLDDISNHVNLSKYHINRIFSAITHKKLMHYVKNRKLTQSIYDLLNTDLKIIDISFEYNYQYEQSYIRSFKKTFGISPEKFRKERPTLKITDKINLNYLTAIGTNGIIIDPVILLKPKFSIVGVKHKLYLKDIDVTDITNENEIDLSHEVVLDFSYNQRLKIENSINPDELIILSSNLNECENKNYIYFTPSQLVPNNRKAPANMFYTKIPTQKYAVFKYIGLHPPECTNFAKLKSIQMYIFSVWLKNSRYTLADDYHLQIMDTSICREDYSEVEFYIPIK
ncbi:MAG: helix-turn-helix domain-containing protein [Clostridiaceae bacterium]